MYSLFLRGLYIPNLFTYNKLNEEYETVCNYSEFPEYINGFGFWTIKKATEDGAHPY